MRLPFSIDELKGLINSDSGFQSFLKTLLPEFSQGFIDNLTADESFIDSLFQLLPPASRDYVVSLLENLIFTPKKAQSLYEHCRFFEARDLLLTSIQLYENPPTTFNHFLNTSLEFVSKRTLALFNDLLADVENELGNTKKSMDYHYKSLALAKEINDLDTIVKAKHSIGLYYLQLGEVEKCLESTHEAHDLIIGQPDQWMSQAKILATLANAYSSLGQPDKANDYIEKAERICVRQNNQSSLPMILNNIACLYWEIDKPQDVLETLQHALYLARQCQDIRQEALILNNLAVLFLKEIDTPDNLEIAKSYLNIAADKSQEIGSLRLEALSINNLGQYFQVNNQPFQAKKAFQNAITKYRNAGLSLDEANSLFTLGMLLKNQLTQPAEAVDCFKKSIKISEKVRGSLKKERDRISYTANITNSYEQIIECLVQLNNTELAIEFTERSKSRSLVEFLAEETVEKKNTGIDIQLFEKASILLKEIGELREAIRAISKKTEKIIDTDFAGKNMSLYEHQTETYLKDIYEKEQEFNDIYSELNIIDPEKTAIIGIQTISVSEIQKCLNLDTALINFFQTQDFLYLFLVSVNEPARNFQIPIRGIDAFEKVKNLLEKLKKKELRDIRSHEFIKEIKQPLSQLFDLIFKPVSTFIQKFSHIIISPHLFWHYFPFQALFNKDKKQYLCDQYHISLCPSASVLKQCIEKNNVNRDSGLILAHGTSELVFVEQEAEKIAQAFNSKADVFLTQEADLEKIEYAKDKYGLIHIACHGNFDSDQPFPSGIHFPSSKSNKQIIYLLEFFKLKIRTNLVTLSACESGLINYTSADELIGISRGLFYAGAASVLLSLWQVADESTCYLMENFYWHYVNNRKTKAESLQLAMQGVKAKKEYAHPYFWAPFTVIGDWR